MPVNIFLCQSIDIIIFYLATLRLMVVFKGFPIDLCIIKTAVLNVISKQIFLFFTAPLINQNMNWATPPNQPPRFPHRREIKFVAKRIMMHPVCMRVTLLLVCISVTKE